LLFFDGADKRLPAWEVTRASGLAVVKHLLGQGQVPKFSAIESLLAPVLEVAPDDTRVMNALTEVALKRDDLAAADTYARQALTVDPQNEAALVALTLVCYQTGRFAEGLEFSDRALAINPMLDNLYAQRADMFRLSQRLTEGIAAAEQSLQLNPRLIPVREWLVHAYRDQGQAAKSDEQMAILRRMEAAPPAKQTVR
jgi:tetratricopeptide (TPR) repeat protein